MKLFQLIDIYNKVILPKYEEFDFSKPLLFLGSDICAPGGEGVYYDAEDKMWKRYLYDDYARKSITGYYHSDEEACEAIYEELMSPILSRQKFYSIEEPTQEDLEAMKLKPFKDDSIYAKKCFWVFDDKVRYSYLYGDTTVLEIPAFYQDIPVTEVRIVKKKVISVKLPKTVKTIMERCFIRCYFSDISLNKGLKKIGNYSFLSCWNLKKIDLPDSLEEIGKCAFAGSGLQEISIPSKITVLEKTFYKTKLVHVRIPGNVIRLENQAFDEIETLEDVYIEEGVQRIGESVFCTNPRLHVIYIPRSVTDIDDLNFLGCASDFYIVTPQGSFADQFARRNKITVVYA